MRRSLLALTLLFALGAHAQINVNKLKNKAQKKLEEGSSKSSDKKTTTTTTNNSGQTSGTTTNQSTTENGSTANTGLANRANFYKNMHSYIDRNLSNAANRSWDDGFLDYLDGLDIDRLEQTMTDDEAVCGNFLMLYPKKLPTSGMGTITRNNLNEFAFAKIADENAEPPAGEDGKKIMKFYIEYCWFKHDLMNGKTAIINNLRSSIQEAESAHPRQQYRLAKLAKRQAEMAHKLLPDDMRIADLKEDADRAYNSVIEGFGKMISGPYHKDHLTEVAVFNKKTSFASESEADELDVIIPGESAYITGYFAMTNKTAGGIPSLVFISPEDPAMQNPTHG